jgi:hypothetical protein
MSKRSLQTDSHTVCSYKDLQHNTIQHTRRFAYGHVDAMRVWANRGSALLACNVKASRSINTERVLHQHMKAHHITIVKTNMEFARVRANGLLALGDKHMVQEACLRGDAPACKFLEKVPQRGMPTKNALQEADQSMSVSAAGAVTTNTTAAPTRSAASMAKAAAKKQAKQLAKEQAKLQQAQLAAEVLA